MRKSSWHVFLMIAPGLAALIAIVRLLGWLETFEWAALDRFFVARPPSPPDERVVIVGITEEDIERYQPYPFTDATLAQLLKKILAQQPTALGLDLIRDIPVPPGSSELIAVFQSTPNLLGVGKLTGVSGDEFFAPIAFPPVLEELGLVADISAVVDDDGVTRRAMLYPLRDGSPNSAIPSLGLALAYQYLGAQGIEAEASDPDGWLQLGDVVFYPFEENDGGYIRSGDGGYQILLNWRGPAQSFERVSVAQVMENQIAPDLLRERVVLIGAYAPSLKDGFFTPFSKGQGTTPKKTYGVEIQANLASQILSTVLDGRPLIKVWPEPLEYLWLLAWVEVTALLIWPSRSHQDLRLLLVRIGFSALLLSALLLAITYWAFRESWWIPLVPPLGGIWAVTLATTAYIYSLKIQSYIQQIEAQNLSLEAQVIQRTGQLKQKASQLEQTLQKLQASQQQMLAQERLVHLGMLTAGIAHELKNPLNVLTTYANLSVELSQELHEELNSGENPQETLLLIEENLETIQRQTVRLTQLTQNLLPTEYPNPSSGEPTPTNLNELLTTAYQLVSYSKNPKEKKFNLTLETDYDPSLGKIKVLATEINQALINLIDNAWDAVFQKQQSQPEDYTPTIILKTQNLGDAVEISISDNGDGIPPEYLGKIFDPFVTTKPPGEGTGLGLSIARDMIVGKHGGEIRLETELGEYTKFVIVLPKN